jgi:hypothetical protein
VKCQPRERAHSRVELAPEGNDPGNKPGPHGNEKRCRRIRPHKFFTVLPELSSALARSVIRARASHLRILTDYPRPLLQIFNHLASLGANLIGNLGGPCFHLLKCSLGAGSEFFEGRGELFTRNAGLLLQPIQQFFSFTPSELAITLLQLSF